MHRSCGAEQRRSRRRGTERVPRRQRAPASAGFTLVEVVVASLILVIAVGGLTGSILAGLKLSRTNEEQARAEAALRAAVARLQGAPFGQAFALFNASALDDPGGVAAPGAGFAVAGLDPVEGDPDGLAGEIVFPSLSVAGVEELREDVLDPGLGMPRDLNGDGGLPDAVDHAEDYVILPVRVRVRWSGASGERALERVMLLVES